MAALNEPYTGNLQGMRIADLNCHRQARRAGLIGTFRAFLSARFVWLLFIIIHFGNFSTWKVKCKKGRQFH